MSPIKDGKPLAAYTRVSSQGDRADEELLSHDLQRERIEAGATAFGYTVADARFEDTNASGGSMDRPAFNRAMAGVRSGEFGGIVVAKLSRFARTTTGGLRAIKEIEEAGGAFVCLDPPIDTQSSTGRFILTIFLALYAMEREATGEIAHAVKDVKIADGVHQSTHAPAGYEFSVAGYKLDRKTGTMQVVRGPLGPGEHADGVRAAFQCRADGGSWADVMRTLTEAGVPSRNGHWSRTGVRSLVENPVYLGVAVSGARRKEKAHEALVSRALFEAANARTGTRPVTWGDREGPLLGGLIKCATCRHAMSLKWTYRKGEDGKHRQAWGTYKCAWPGCSAKAGISTLQVEPYVVDLALGQLGEVIAYTGREPVEDPEAWAEWEARLEALREEQADLDAADDLSATAYAQAVTRLERKRARLEAERPAAVGGRRYLAYASASNLRDAFEAASVSERRGVLEDLVERVVVEPGKGNVEARVTVDLRGPDMTIPAAALEEAA